MQKVRIVSRENSLEDFLLLVDTKKAEGDSHRPIPSAVPSALQKGVTVTRESSHPLGICRTPSSTPVQLDFASSSVEFNSPLEQIRGSRSTSLSSEASLSSTGSSVSSGQNSHSLNRNHDPGQCLANDGSCGTRLSVHSDKDGSIPCAPSNGAETLSSSKHSCSRHLSGQSSTHELTDCQLSNCLASCSLEKTSKGGELVKLCSQHSNNDSKNTVKAQDSEQTCRSKQVEMVGGMVCGEENEEDIERDGPSPGYGDVAKDATIVTPNVLEKNLPSELADIAPKHSRKNALKKKSRDEDGLKSRSAEALIQREQFGGRGSAPNSPCQCYQNRAKQGRQSDPGKRPIYLMKSKLVNRAFSEPNQVRSYP